MKMKMNNAMVGAMLVILLTMGIGHADLNDGLMAYYPFNGNTNDETGNYPPLSIYGTLSTSDRFGNPNSAYCFDGVDDYMDGISYDIINPSAPSSFAVSFWFMPTSTWSSDSSTTGMIVGNKTGSGWTDWGVFVDASYLGRLQFNVYDDPYPNPPATVYTSTDRWQAGTWYHLVYSYDAFGESLSVWVNGILEDSITMTHDIGRDYGDTLKIGLYNFEHVDMTFDELRLYSRALSESEIQQLAGGEPTPVVKDFYLHGVAPELTLDNSAPTGATAKYKDSPSLRRTEFKEIGTWDYTVPSAMSLQSAENLRVWVGLKNSDDQGTYFDVCAQLLKKNETEIVIASCEALDIRGVTRNPDKAKEVPLNFGAISNGEFEAGDTLSLRILTRVTAVGGHSNAVGLRLYYDSVSRPSGLTVTSSQ